MKRLNLAGFKTVGYADDLTILIRGKYANVLLDRMQEALNLIENWCNKQCLSVNPKKTEMVLFTRKRNIGNPRLPTLAKIPLKLSTEVKYLGLIIDSKLTWKSHLDNRVNKACVAFGQCRRAVGRTWGLSPKIALWIYTAVVRPMLTYGAVVWWTRTSKSTATTALNRIQRLACLYVTGALRSTPTAAMEIMLNLPPLNLHIQEVALVTMKRLQSVGTMKDEDAGSSSTLWREAVLDTPLLECKTDHRPAKYVFSRKYLTHVSPTVVDVHRTLKIYTDGSKGRNGAGAGVFSHDPLIRLSEPLGSSTTVIQAELTAIKLAADCIVESNKRALSRVIITSAVVMDCHKALEEAAKYNSVRIQWIKGHSGSKGNNHADRLAKRAAGRAPCAPEPIITPSLATHIELIKHITHKKFLNGWDRTPGCHLAKELLKYPSAATAQFFVGLGKSALRTATGLLTGHCKVNKHLQNMKLADSPLCRACEQDDETVKHILCDCPSLTDLRMRTFGEEWPTTDDIRNAPLGAVLAFGKSLGWLM
nr:uncharacterized protein LOC111415306 [Onthophagus taurus]